MSREEEQSSQIKVQLFQPAIPQEMRAVMNSIAFNENSVAARSIGEFTYATGVTSLSRLDRNRGSLEYLNDEYRILFYKTSPKEVDTTRLFTQQLGISGMLEYIGAVSTLDNFYAVASLPSSALNMELIEPGRGKQKNSFSTFQVLDHAAAMLASLHRQGFVHGDFTINHFIDTRDTRRPNDSLRFYGTTSVQKTTNTEIQEKDIIDFLSSIQITDENRMKSFMQVYKNYYG